VGSTLEIWRPLKLKHPVTGKVLTDRFKIGAVDVVQVRKVVSLAKPSGALARDARRRRDPPPAPKAAPPPPPSPSTAPPEGTAAPPPPSPAEDDEHAIGALLDSLRGADLQTRIRRYEDFAKRRPTRSIPGRSRKEAASLRRLAEGRHAPRDSEPMATALSFNGPTEVVDATPLRIGIELNDLATGAVLHVRAHGDPVYQSFLMTSEGRATSARRSRPSA